MPCFTLWAETRGQALGALQSLQAQGQTQAAGRGAHAAFSSPLHPETQAQPWLREVWKPMGRVKTKTIC